MILSCQINPAAISLKLETSLVIPGPNDVLVYWANLDTLTVHSGLLSDSEQLRAGQYVHIRDQNRFTVRRSLLRLLLSAFLRLPASSIPLKQTAEGKPYLDLQEDICPIEFSLSHSQGIAAFAFTAGRRVGIDIEKMDPAADCQSLAREYFTVEEARYINLQDEPSSIEAFFLCWTRKEAYLKAAGIRPLDSFDTGLQTNQIFDMQSPQLNNHWAIARLELVPGWLTSLVVETAQGQPVSVIAQCIQNLATIE